MLGVLASAVASRRFPQISANWIDYERAAASVPKSAGDAPTLTASSDKHVELAARNEDQMSHGSSEDQSDVDVCDLPEASSDQPLRCPCPGCHITFRVPKHFIVHVQTHAAARNAPPAACIVCGQDFVTVAALEYHVLEHTDYRPFSCQRCGVRVASGWSLRRHALQCPQEAVRSRPGKRPLHQSRAAEDEDHATMLSQRPEKKVSLDPSEPLLKCNICGEMLTNLSALIAHNYRMHAASLEPSVDDHIKHFPQAASTEYLCCDKCSFRTSSADRMQQHEAQHKCSDWIRCIRYQGGANGLPENQQQLVAPRGDLADIRSILSLTNSSAAARLSAHPTSPHRADRASTSPPPQYPLKESGDRLLPTLLMGGEEVNDDVEDPSFDIIRSMKAKGEFPCRLCEQVFPNLRAMKGHNRVHMGAAPYQCNVCVFSSGDKATLVRHMKQHNGERPYECRVCRFAFTTKANCERHLKNRHQIKIRDLLNDSMTIHMNPDGQAPQKLAAPATILQITTVSCSVCASELRNPKLLKEHLRSQHRIVPEAGIFTCAICDMQFPDQIQALQHVRKHHISGDRDINGAQKPRKKEDCSDLSSVESLIDQSKRLPLQFPMPPTMINIPNLIKPFASQFSPPQTVASPPTIVTASNPPPFAVASLKPMVTKEAPPIKTEPVAVSAQPMETEDDLDAPLDLSLKPLEKDKKSSDTEEPAESEPTEPEPKMPSIMGGPFSLYMPYGAAMPFFVMPGMLGYPMDDQWRNNFNRDLSCNMQLNSAGAMLSPQSQISALSSAISLAAQAHNEGDRKELPISNRRWMMPEELPSMTMTALNESPAAAVHDPVVSAEVVQKPKQRRYRTLRPFSCSYCEARFTLSTNMDRHVKNHHPDKWERKSRGSRRSSAVSAPDSSPKHVTATTPLPAGEDTAAAAAAALAVDGCCVSDEESQLVIDEPEPVRRDEDLVSVTRLVDQAQAQTFQQYFGSGGATEEEEPSEDAASGTSNDESDPSTGEKRRSAYSSAPNKIPCRVCKREFPWTSSLKRHELTHSGEKPYRCPHCPVNFTTKSNCDRHVVRKHSAAAGGGGAGDLGGAASEEGGERPFRCQLCTSFTFSTQENLERHHAEKHAPDALHPPVQHRFWCHICETVFFDLEKTKDHVEAEHEQAWADLERSNVTWALHIAEEDQGSDKLFCMICAAGFNFCDQLATHLVQRHLVPADYRCAICAEPHPSDSSLLRHQRRAHPPAPSSPAPTATVRLPEQRAKKREHLNDISARLSASRLRLATKDFGEGEMESVETSSAIPPTTPPSSSAPAMKSSLCSVVTSI